MNYIFHITLVIFWLCIILSLFCHILIRLGWRKPAEYTNWYNLLLFPFLYIFFFLFTMSFLNIYKFNTYIHIQISKKFTDTSIKSINIISYICIVNKVEGKVLEKNISYTVSKVLLSITAAFNWWIKHSISSKLIIR